MKRRSRAARLARLGALAWVASCLDSTAPAPAPRTVATLAITPFTATIGVGDTLRLTAMPRDAVGAPLPGRAVVWASGAPEVATVSVDGLVTGMADGAVTITATSEGAHGQALVTVAHPPPAVPQLVVSNAVPSPQGAAALASTPRGVNTSSNDLGDSVAFVSLTPGAAPSGATATVQNPAAGQSLTTVMSNGGFDPVTIGASVGDSIRVVVRDEQNAVVLEAQTVVAAARRPIVVRTEPPPKKRDVPLNTPIVIVFSEPVAAGTVTLASIRLITGLTLVPGTVDLGDASGLVALFTPAAPLSPNTEYRLLVTQAVTDFDGDPLGAPAVVEFVSGTATTEPGPVASVTMGTVLIESSFGSTTLIRAHVRDANGTDLVGQTVTWTTSDPSVATVSPTVGTVAQGFGSETYVTLRAGGVATITATSSGKVDTTVVFSRPFPPGIQTGALRIVTTTTGVDIDADGYTVVVVGDCGFRGCYFIDTLALGTSDTTTISGLEPGGYGVGVRGAAAGCRVRGNTGPGGLEYGSNGLYLAVVPDRSTEAVFEISCSGIGRLRMTVATTGVDVDPDGYWASWDASWNAGPPTDGAVFVRINDTVTVDSLPAEAGDYVVGLGHVSPNCTSSPHPVHINRTDTAEVALVVTCAPRQPPVASVRVTPDSATLDPGDSLRFTAVPLDSAGNPIPGLGPVWSLSNSTVAALSTDGLVTARLAGTTTVVAEFVGGSGSAQLTVSGTPPNIGGEWRVIEDFYVPGEYLGSVDRVCSDTGTFALSQDGFTFTGTSTQVGSCGHEAPRSVTGGVVSGALLDFRVGSCEYHVEVYIHWSTPLEGMWGSANCSNGLEVALRGARPGATDSVTIQPATASIVVGGSLALTADVWGGLMVFPVAWSSDNPAIAYVSAAGRVTGLSAGTATITAAADGKSGTARITVTMPSQLSFGAVSAGGFHTCGTTASGAYCWGETFTGDSGTIRFENFPTPVAVPGGIHFASLSAGWGHTCALTSAGAAYCWGTNDAGQLGNGVDRASSAAPVRVAGNLTFTSVTAGATHTCGLTAAGAAYCWGWNNFGQIGNGDAHLEFYLAPTPVAGGHTFVSLSAGSYHTCGVIASGAAYCWGTNTQGQLGVDSSDQRFHPTPLAVASGLTFTTVSAGGAYTCGVTTGGAAYCWGANDEGQLGIGVSDAQIHPSPVAVAGGLTFASLGAAGSRHVCGLTSGAAAYCWGSNFSGELGDDDPTALKSAPVPVAGGFTFGSLSAGGMMHTCGRTTGGVVYCWGANTQGQLGNPWVGDSGIPVKVTGQP